MTAPEPECTYEGPKWTQPELEPDDPKSPVGYSQLPLGPAPWNITPWDGTAATLDYHEIRDSDDGLVARVGRVPIETPRNLAAIASVPLLLALLRAAIPHLPPLLSHYAANVLHQVERGQLQARFFRPSIPTTKKLAEHLPELERADWTE